MSDVLKNSETIETNAPVVTTCNVVQCNTQAHSERIFGDTYYNAQKAVRVVTISAGVNQKDIQGGITAEISLEETEGFIRVAMLHCGWYGTTSEHLYGSMTFLVPPGWYYRTYAVGTQLKLHEWVEWDLTTDFDYFRP